MSFDFSPATSRMYDRVILSKTSRLLSHLTSENWVRPDGLSSLFSRLLYDF